MDQKHFMYVLKPPLNFPWDGETLIQNVNILFSSMNTVEEE